MFLCVPTQCLCLCWGPDRPKLQCPDGVSHKVSASAEDTMAIAPMDDSEGNLRAHAYKPAALYCSRLQPLLPLCLLSAGPAPAADAERRPLPITTFVYNLIPDPSRHTHSCTRDNDNDNVPAQPYLCHRCLVVREQASLLHAHANCIARLAALEPYQHLFPVPRTHAVFIR